jgi:hypothetical protein
MNLYDVNYDFPKQKIPSSKKNKAWAASCCDWIIAKALSCRKDNNVEMRYNILNGRIPQEYYKKILNPYNATQEKYKKFPATMRNYDMMKGVIRRYVSEYLKNPHEFIVGANNPDIILAKNTKLRMELAKLVEQEIAAQIQQMYSQWVAQGNDPKQFNPESQLDVEAFIKNFNDNYIDDVSAQGQELLDVIKDITEDTLFYTNAYFNFVAFGETYTYSDVMDDKLIKRVIAPRDAFPVPTNNMFVEDDDMFACRRKMSYQEIIDEFDDYFTKEQKDFIDRYLGQHYGTTSIETYNFKTFERTFPDVCGKFSKEDRDMLTSKDSMRRDANGGLYDVWHVVWRGFARKAIVTYINESQMIATRVELESYKLNKEIGDIDIEYIYEPQVYECVRIGGREEGIYPYGARAIAYERKGKLPYNGLNELLPGFGTFSIIDIMTPYQVFYNIVAYQREMVIARNKLSVLMVAKSLLGKDPEDTIYKMLADGVLYIDDTNDQGMIRAQQVRMLNADLSKYIVELTQLMADIDTAAKNQVDMTPQRFGDIANSAGKGTTEEAIARGSMGSVIVEYMMDCVRERDYARDMDYTKLAWIEGLNTSYRDKDNELKYISLNIDNHIYADYVIKAKNSYKEQRKLEQLRQFAFNASQNGDIMMALSAITGDNVASITKLIKRYNAEKQQHEQQMQQMEQQLEQMKQEFEIQKIMVKGEEDRKTEELRGIIDKEIELIKADANMISYNAEVGDSAKQLGIDRLNESRAEVDKEKVRVAREKNILDAYNKAEDRRVKEKDIEAKIKIAKMNKNRYDVGHKSKK